MKNGFIYHLFSSVREFHHEVVYNVLTFKNLLDWRSLPALIVGFWLALSLSELLFTVFIIFYLLDYVTGIIASVVELRKNPLRLERRKRRKGRLYWVSSSRLIRGLVKLLVYFQLILVVVVLSHLLHFKEIVLHEKIIPLTPLQVLLVLCIASELVSNLENAKRSGFDLVGMAKQTIIKITELKNLTKN